MTTLLGTEHRPLFRHAPLDHTQPSIRLIEITPSLSAEGLISCVVSHATIGTDYVCLSYRWGEEKPNTSKNILLDGKLFTVRQNLYDFLHRASTEPEWSQVTQKKYWIDALCINQSDGIERNHQVAQMGGIFASARLVHVWLGKTSNVDRMSTLLSMSPSTGSKQIRPFELQTNLELIGRYVLHNEYWSRAWVVQEIVLARNVAVSLNVTTLSLHDFCKRIDCLRLDLTQTPFKQFQIYHTPGSLQPLRNMSLLSLLDRFRDKDCAVPRDRVFSLLAMCHPEEQIQVDYGSPWTNLFAQILAKAKHIPCTCSAALLARSLTPSPAKSDDTDPYAEPMLTFEIEDVLVGCADLLMGALGPGGPNSSRQNEWVEKGVKNHKLGNRACFWDLLRILRLVINEIHNPNFIPGRSSSNAPLGYQRPLRDILNSSPKCTLSNIPPWSFVSSFRGFLGSSLQRNHAHRFQRMGTTLRLFNVAPG